jgi:Flp pilus assembly protein TadB
MQHPLFKTGLRRFFWILLIAIMAIGCNATMMKQRQDDRRIAGNKKEISKKQDERTAAYLKQAERQKKMQTKETRKRMKELEKRSKRWRDGKKEPFYEKWMYDWGKRRQDRKDRRQE